MAWFQKKQQPIKAEIPQDYGETGRLDERSPTWVFLSGWASEEMARLREKNDSTALTDHATAALRGRIQMLKDVLDLPNAGKGLLNR